MMWRSGLRAGFVVWGVGLIVACGSSTEDLGDLSLAGPDTAVVGVSYEPSNASVGFPQNDQVSWGFDGSGRNLTVELREDGSLRAVELAFFSNGGGDYVYFYRLECAEDTSSCARVGIDFAERTIAFANTELPDAETAGTVARNESTAPIFVSGTLRWD